MQALQQPWHVFIAYNGYEQLVPRVLAQFALYLPLAQASRLFAVCGALIAVGCGLFVFHASAGHIRSVPLRALLAAARRAAAERADGDRRQHRQHVSWYLLLAMFWAAAVAAADCCKGMAAAALVAFVPTVASNSLAILFVPLVAARLYVLRSLCEHAVTAGWLAGWTATYRPSSCRACTLPPGHPPAWRGGQRRPGACSPTTPTKWCCRRSAGTWRGGWSRSPEETGPRRSWPSPWLAVFGAILATQPGTGHSSLIALLDGLRLLHGLGTILTPWVTASPVYDSSTSQAPATPRCPSS